MTNQKALINPAERRAPVNISMELKLLDRLDEEAFRRYGLSNGARSKVACEILKDYFKIN